LIQLPVAGLRLVRSGQISTWTFLSWLMCDWGYEWYRRPGMSPMSEIGDCFADFALRAIYLASR
jgi:hypothetical protein